MCEYTIPAQWARSYRNLLDWMDPKLGGRCMTFVMTLFSNSSIESYEDGYESHGQEEVPYRNSNCDKNTMRHFQRYIIFTWLYIIINIPLSRKKKSWKILSENILRRFGNVGMTQNQHFEGNPVLNLTRESGFGAMPTFLNCWNNIFRNVFKICFCSKVMYIQCHVGSFTKVTLLSQTTCYPYLSLLQSISSCVANFSELRQPICMFF